MSEILTCLLCGRRGTNEFVMVAADPAQAEAGHRARCANRRACQRRIDQNTQTQADTSAGDAGSGESTSEGVSPDALAGLARELETLRRSIEASQGIPARVEELARLVRELAEQVRARAGRRNGVSAPSWLDLPGDAQAAHAVLRELVSWLREVYLRYADARKGLPECWLWHPDVVEELLWLMYAWHAAYRDEHATVALAGDWHDRYRPGVVRRVKQAAGTCSLENHLPSADGVGGARPVVPIAEAMAPIAAWWAEQREQAPPEPTSEQVAASAARPARGGGRR